jgi:hypothetical protein
MTKCYPFVGAFVANQLVVDERLVKIHPFNLIPLRQVISWLYEIDAGVGWRSFDGVRRLNVKVVAVMEQVLMAGRRIIMQIVQSQVSRGSMYRVLDPAIRFR